MPEQTLTTPAVVEAALVRSLTDAENEHIDSLIEQVSDQLRTIRPDVDLRLELWDTNRADRSALAPSVVAGMLAVVLKRALINPRGLWSTNEADGDYNISETYPGQRAGANAGTPGDLEITAADLAKIAPRRARPRGTIHVSYGLSR